MCSYGHRLHPIYFCILYISALLTTQQQVPLLNMKQRVRITIIEAEINANMMRENLYTGSF